MRKDEKIRRLVITFIVSNNKKDKNAKKAKSELVKLANESSATNVVKLFEKSARDFFWW